MFPIGQTKEWLKSHLSEDVICQIRHYHNYRLFKELRYQKGEFSLRDYDRKQCIFIHISKTAGTSVNRALFGNRGGGHKSARYYKQIFGVSTFKKYFKFTFVRNPYSRLLSAYYFLMNGGYGVIHRRWVRENISEYKTFNDFVVKWLNRDNIYKRCHFFPQTHYISNENHELEVDYIGRYENIQEDFQLICDKLNIVTDLPHCNSSGIDGHWSSFYTTETLRIVEEIYKEDFELLGYKMISTNRLSELIA